MPRDLPEVRLCLDSFLQFVSFLEAIRALQCRDCSNVSHEKCRSLASGKPCRRVTSSGTTEPPIVVNSSRFETGSVTGRSLRLTVVLMMFIVVFKDITDVLLDKAGKLVVL